MELLLFILALTALALMPGWRSWGVACAAIVLLLIVITTASTGPAVLCSGFTCAGGMAGYVLKGPITVAAWFLVLVVAGLRASRISMRNEVRRNRGSS